MPPAGCVRRTSAAACPADQRNSVQPVEHRDVDQLRDLMLELGFGLSIVHAQDEGRRAAVIWG